jgi:hypothetical protein
VPDREEMEPLPQPINIVVMIKIAATAPPTLIPPPDDSR